MDIRIVDGRLTKDAEVKTNKTGVKFLSFTLANNRFANGEQTTTYFNVVSYNPYDVQKHENDKSYTKGKLVVVSGRPNEVMTIKDNKTYLNRNIIANSIEPGSYNVTKENGQQATTYRDVAPAPVTAPAPTVPLCEAPRIPHPQVTVPPVASPVSTPQVEVNETSAEDDLPF
jgi:single-stranded DNA-binding protein